MKKTDPRKSDANPTDTALDDSIDHYDSERTLDCYYEMCVKLEEQGFRRDAFFNLLATKMFSVTDEAPSSDVIGAIKYRFVSPEHLEVTPDFGREVLRIKASTFRHFDFLVCPWGSTLEVSVVEHGSDDQLAAHIQEVLPLIRTALSMRIQQTNHQTTIIVRLDASEMYTNIVYLEEALRAIATIFDHTAAYFRLKRFH